MNFSLTLNITCYVLATLCWLPGQFSLHTFKYIIFIKKKTNIKYATHFN